ncbi:MAG TPA: SurA N-terminal domain-containing protein [Myxococcaceae bacterium]|nr:SurA N-terminal domain-containing protein [Myxococcaceae bacterium]
MNERSQRFSQFASLAFIILIGVVFALQFGPGSRGCDARLREEAANSAAAVVNGKEINARDFARAYANRVDQFRGQGLTNDILRQLGVPKQVLDQLIDVELLAQAAERNGISTSDAELMEVLQSQSLFQRDGVFDPQLYKQNVRGYYGKSAADFEAELRRTLTAQKQIELLLNGALVSEDEVRARFEREGNLAEIAFVRFEPTMFVDRVEAPSDAALGSFAAEHADAIRQRYEADQALYSEPEKVQARQILIRVEEGAGPEAQAQAQETLAGLKKQLEEGADFATLAREHSDDPGTAEQGGDLGWVDRSAFGGVLSEAVFNLSAGQVTEPIATQYGVHLVQVQDKRPAVTRSLEEVTPEIARSLYTQEEAKRLARAAADAALTTARAGTPLATQFPAPTGDDAALSGSSDPQVVETGSFSASAGAIPQLGSAPELSRAVFAREDAGLLDQTFQAGEAWVVAEVRSRTLPSSEAFASQEASLREEARRAKQYELRDAYVKQLREDARIVVNDQTVDAAVGG